MIEFIWYLSLFIIGVTLDLVGAGGSILTIPILTQFFKVHVILSTTYSLFIVTISVLVGRIRYRKLISFKSAVFFAISSSIIVFTTRFYVVPHLPNHFDQLSLDDAFIGTFIVIMILAGYFMIKAPNNTISVMVSIIEVMRGILALLK